MKWFESKHNALLPSQSSDGNENISVAKHEKFGWGVLSNLTDLKLFCKEQAKCSVSKCAKHATWSSTHRKRHSVFRFQVKSGFWIPYFIILPILVGLCPVTSLYPRVWCFISSQKLFFLYIVQCTLYNTELEIKGFFFPFFTSPHDLKIAFVSEYRFLWFIQGWVLCFVEAKKTQLHHILILEM